MFCQYTWIRRNFFRLTYLIKNFVFNIRKLMNNFLYRYIYTGIDRSTLSTIVLYLHGVNVPCPTTSLKGWIHFIISEYKDLEVFWHDYKWKDKVVDPILIKSEYTLRPFNNLYRPFSWSIVTDRLFQIYKLKYVHWPLNLHKK